MPHDSPGTSFLVPKITTKFELDPPLRGRQMQGGALKSATFNKKLAITRKRYNIYA